MAASRSRPPVDLLWLFLVLFIYLFNFLFSHSAGIEAAYAVAASGPCVLPCVVAVLCVVCDISGCNASVSLASLQLVRACVRSAVVERSPRLAGAGGSASPALSIRAVQVCARDTRTARQHTRSDRSGAALAAAPWLPAQQPPTTAHAGPLAVSFLFCCFPHRPLT